MKIDQSKTVLFFALLNSQAQPSNFSGRSASQTEWPAMRLTKTLSEEAEWSGWRDLNPRPRRPERRALPTALQPVAFFSCMTSSFLYLPSRTSQTRTGDLLHPMQARYQLRYSPAGQTKTGREHPLFIRIGKICNTSRLQH